MHFVDLQYEPNENCTRDFPPFVKNVYLDNVTSKQSRFGVYIAAFADLKNVLNINLMNCTWTNVKENNRLEGWIDGFVFRNTIINGEMVK